MPFPPPAAKDTSAAASMNKSDMSSKARNIKRRKKRRGSVREERDHEQEQVVTKKPRKTKTDREPKKSASSTRLDLEMSKTSEEQPVRNMLDASAVQDAPQAMVDVLPGQPIMTDRLYLSQKERKAARKALKRSRKSAAAAGADSEEVVADSQPDPVTISTVANSANDVHPPKSSDGLDPMRDQALEEHEIEPSKVSIDSDSPQKSLDKPSPKITQPSQAERTARLSKMRSAIRKYLRHTTQSERDFAVSLSVGRIVDSPFYSFAKKYFARDDEHAFELLVRSALSTEPNTAAPSKKRSRAAMENLATAEATDFTKVAKSRSKDVVDRVKNAHELAHKEYAESGRSYINGAFSGHEEAILRKAVEEYQKQHDLSHVEFCSLLHSDAPQKEKNLLYAEFIYLFDNRKPKNVKDHLRRAYLPYERSAFSKEDDQRILTLRSELGADWVAIAGEMGRYAHDVRDRYRNHLANASGLTGAWSPAENAKFETILSSFSSKEEMNWGAIAKEMGTRTRVQCRDRFLRLQGGRSKSNKPSSKVARFEGLVPTKLSKEMTGLTAIESQVEEKKPKSSRMSRAAILPGDVLHMLLLLQKSELPSIEVAIEKDIFSEYNNVFSKTDIQAKLSRELGASKLTSSDKLRHVVAKLEQLDGSQLKRTLVQDSEDE